MVTLWPGKCQEEKPFLILLRPSDWDLHIFAHLILIISLLWIGYPFGLVILLTRTRARFRKLYWNDEVICLEKWQSWHVSLALPVSSSPIPKHAGPKGWIPDLGFPWICCLCRSELRDLLSYLTLHCSHADTRCPTSPTTEYSPGCWPNFLNQPYLSPQFIRSVSPTRTILSPPDLSVPMLVQPQTQMTGISPPLRAASVIAPIHSINIWHPSRPWWLNYSSCFITL